MTIEIVDFPMKIAWWFSSSLCNKLPEGNCPILGILNITEHSSHYRPYTDFGWVMFNGDIEWPMDLLNFPNGNSTLGIYRFVWEGGGSCGANPCPWNSPAVPKHWRPNRQNIKGSSQTQIQEIWPSQLGKFRGSMVLVYMLTWLGYIDGIHVTINIAAPWIRHG